MNLKELLEIFFQGKASKYDYQEPGNFAQRTLSEHHWPDSSNESERHQKMIPNVLYLIATHRGVKSNMTIWVDWKDIQGQYRTGQFDIEETNTNPLIQVVYSEELKRLDEFGIK
jgi:hypothetical protein